MDEPLEPLRVACIRHAPGEGPGTIAAWATQRGHALTVHDPHAEDPLPSADQLDLLVLLGGPMGVGDVDRHPWLVEERRLALAVAEGGGGVLGICFGAQQLAAALGAQVRPNPTLEVGWWPVRLTEAGRASSIVSTLPAEWLPFHTHGQTFDLPDGCANLASSEACEHQAFEAFGGRAVGLQFHPEIELDQIAAVAANAERDGVAEGTVPSVQHPSVYLHAREVPERIEAMHRAFWRMLDAWAAR